MHKGQIVLEGEEKEIKKFLSKIGSSQKPLNPHRVIRPPLGKDIVKLHKRDSSKPANLAAWKKTNWGTEKIDKAEVIWQGQEKAILKFSSDSFPEPLVREIMKTPLAQGALLLGSDEVAFFGEFPWRGPRSALEHVEDLQELGLLEFLQGKIRTTASIKDLEQLQRGRSVRADVFGQSFSIQRDLLGNSCADLVIDDTTPLDDVLVAWYGDLCLLLDLEK